MEYIPLTQLDNQYPSIDNYSLTYDNKIMLSGNYPNNNIIFPKPSIDSIEPIPNTYFRFILSVSSSYDTVRYITSQAYYDDLQLSLEENNPYFAIDSVKSYNIVKIDLTSAIDNFNKYSIIESNNYLDVELNSFITKSLALNGSGSVDYNALGKYIDWVVSSVDGDQIENGGVIYWDDDPVMDLCKYSVNKPLYKNKFIEQFDVSIEGGNTYLISYLSKCKEKDLLGNVKKKTTYEWISGETITINNNSDTKLVLSVKLGDAISKLFKLYTKVIEVDANSSKSIKLLNPIKSSIDASDPESTNIKYSALGVEYPAGYLTYDYEYKGWVELKSDIKTVTIPVSLRKQAGDSFNYTTNKTMGDDYQVTPTEPTTTPIVNPPTVITNGDIITTSIIEYGNDGIITVKVTNRNIITNESNTYIEAQIDTNADGYTSLSNMTTTNGYFSTNYDESGNATYNWLPN